MWDINMNAHYVFHAGSVGIYPLAGVCVLGAKPEHGDGDTEFGGNLGGDVEFFIANGIKLNFEGKYQIVSDWDRPVISIGVSFPL